MESVEILKNNTSEVVTLEESKDLFSGNRELNELKLFLKVKDRDRINQELSMYRGNIERNESEIEELKEENKKLDQNREEANRKI